MWDFLLILNVVFEDRFYDLKDQMIRIVVVAKLCANYLDKVISYLANI